jgi:hypothetical protein
VPTPAEAVKCVDLRLGSTAPYTLLEQWDCHNNDKQLWQPVSLGNGYLKYVNLGQSRRFLNPEALA